MSREEIDTLIVSDVHFGSELCNAELLFEVMSRYEEVGMRIFTFLLHFH